MANGMTVLVLEQHFLPIVEIHALIKAGSAQDIPEKAGVANLVASLLDEGTTTRSSKQLAEQIDFVGGSLEVRAGEDFTTASARVLKKDVDLGFTLLADILLHPAFPKQEFDRAMEFVLAARQPEDAVVVVGLTTVPYTEYFRTGWTVVETGDELVRAEAGAGRTWLLYTFPTHLATKHPEVWRRVGTEYQRVTEFPGTVGGGSVHVMLGP